MMVVHLSSTTIASVQPPPHSTTHPTMDETTAKRQPPPTATVDATSPGLKSAHPVTSIHKPHGPPAPWTPCQAPRTWLQHPTSNAARLPRGQGRQRRRRIKDDDGGSITAAAADRRQHGRQPRRHDTTRRGTEGSEITRGDPSRGRPTRYVTERLYISISPGSPFHS